MAEISPHKLVLNCYGHRTFNNRWYGVCLELNLAAEAGSSDELREKLYDMVISYIETVLDTDEKESIPHLLTRRAPIKDWLAYYVIRLLMFIKKFPNNFTFKQIIPFHLAHSCWPRC
jgi:hypothetical protein